jgi:hypothetical protein
MMQLGARRGRFLSRGIPPPICQGTRFHQVRHSDLSEHVRFREFRRSHAESGVHARAFSYVSFARLFLLFPFDPKNGGTSG